MDTSTGFVSFNWRRRGRLTEGALTLGHHPQPGCVSRRRSTAAASHPHVAAFRAGLTGPCCGV
jgi:hypothetical protein